MVVRRFTSGYLSALVSITWFIFASSFSTISSCLKRDSSFSRAVHGNCMRIFCRNNRASLCWISVEGQMLVQRLAIRMCAPLFAQLCHMHILLVDINSNPTHDNSPLLFSSWKLTSILSSSGLILVIRQRPAKHWLELFAQGLDGRLFDFQGRSPCGFLGYIIPAQGITCEGNG